MNGKIPILIDSSYLVALFSVKDKDHLRARRFAQGESWTLFLPEVVLTEVAYLVRRAGGKRAEVIMMKSVARSNMMLQSLSTSDVERAAVIMEAYPQAELDFVDCCIAAVAERLDIKHISTFDLRDFSMMRPPHCDYFTLLPE